VTPDDAALAWIRSALREQHPSLDHRDTDAIGEQMHTAAKDFDVPVEELIKWIRDDRTASVEQWTAHCAWYVAFRRQWCRQQA
jgi:hypothetical protein